MENNNSISDIGYASNDTGSNGYSDNYPDSEYTSQTPCEANESNEVVSHHL